MTSDVQTGIMQTALDIDDAILREVKALHEREGRSMGAVVSELLLKPFVQRRSSLAADGRSVGPRLR